MLKSFFQYLDFFMSHIEVRTDIGPGDVYGSPGPEVENETTRDTRYEGPSETAHHQSTGSSRSEWELESSRPRSVGGGSS